MIMISNIYIKQNGNILSNNNIISNKYDNKINVLHFILDDSYSQFTYKYIVIKKNNNILKFDYIENFEIDNNLTNDINSIDLLLIFSNNQINDNFQLNNSYEYIVTNTLSLSIQDNFL